MTWFNTEIPEGCYENTDMNKYIQRVMKDAMHYDITNDGAGRLGTAVWAHGRLGAGRLGAGLYARGNSIL